MLRAYTVEGVNMTTDICPDCTVISYGLGGRGAHLAIPSIIAPVLTFLLVSNRIYWRCKLVGRLGPDDLWTLLALVNGATTNAHTTRLMF